MLCELLHEHYIQVGGLGPRERRLHRLYLGEVQLKELVQGLDRGLAGLLMDAGVSHLELVVFRALRVGLALIQSVESFH